jgi:cellulose synthase/poly-beta-1,6-N-acetylglucosamine synthase-like glycosyltransferase
MGGITETMKISIIICAYNEETGIGRLLRNLTAQTLPPEITDYEVIVVASGCTDRTIPIVETWRAHNPRIRLIREEARRGKASALNTGLKAASGEVIVSIPADVLPVEGGLYHLLQPFRDPQVSAVSGNPTQHPQFRRTGLLGKIADITYGFWVEQMRTLNDAGLAAHSSGEFMAMRAGVVAHIPEVCAAEDSYISILARRRGFIKFASRAVAYNIMPANLVDYVNQRRRWLFGHLQTYQLTGEYPTVMDTLIFHKPRIALRILRAVLLEDPARIPLLVAAVCLEAGIYACTVLDMIAQRQYAVWPIIQSTKQTLGGHEEEEVASGIR